jgi:hypothetical protein
VIMGTDQFLDVGRSATNVVGNSVAAAVIAKWEATLCPERSGIDEGAPSNIRSRPSARTAMLDPRKPEAGCCRKAARKWRPPRVLPRRLQAELTMLVARADCLPAIG